MNILGINISHDRAAALVQDGAITAYIAEERLDRNKHSFGNTLPKQAIAYVLEQAGLTLSQLDMIGLSSAEVEPAVLQQAVQKDFQRYFGQIPIEIVGHHYSHAATAYYCSPYREAAIWVADGGGDMIPDIGQEAESYFVAHETQIRHLYTRYQAALLKPLTDEGFAIDERDFGKPISIGRKYEQVTYLLGFTFGQSGKTMGLSAYGQDRGRWRPQVIPGSRFEPQLTVEDLVHPLIQSNDARLQNAPDIAAEVQSFIEDCALLCIKQLYEQTGSQNLCIAGGVGLNCVLNSRIAQEMPFQSIFVFPGAGDDGQAIGNALHCYFGHGGTKRYPFLSASLGRSYPEDTILAAIHASGLPYSRAANLHFEAAQHIARGAIVAWFQGGSECGPRALGFRSILADPRNPQIKDILNYRVKHREPFRPYAPAVLDRFAHDYFVYPASPSLPFMLLTGLVKADKREVIPGVVHVDGTARLQVVDEQSNRELYQLLSAFHAITAVPVILNTSFNVAGEPIVESPTDALRCFQATDIDHLVMGDFIVGKDLARS